MAKFQLRLLSSGGKPTFHLKIGQVFGITQEYTRIGRTKENHLSIPANGVSKYNSLITTVEDRLILKDLDSKNGTFLNGYLVKQKEITIGDQISIDSFVFKVEAFRASDHPNIMSSGAADAGEKKAEAAKPVEDMLTIEREETAEQKKIREENTVSGLDRFMERVDKLYLSKLYFALDRVPTRIAIIMFLLGSCALTFLPILYQIHSLTLHIVGREVQEYSKFVARQMAKVNSVPIREKKFTKVNLADFEKASNVDEVYILDRSGKAILPEQLRGKTLGSSASMRGATMDISKSEMIEREGSQLIVSHPIYEADKKIAGINQIVAVAQVWLSPTAEKSYSVNLFSAGLFVLVVMFFMSVVFYFFLFKTIAFPLSNLSEQGNEIITTQQGTMQLPQKGREIKILKDKLNFFMEQFLKKVNPDDGNKPKGERLWSLNHTNFVEGHALMVLNKEGKIVEYNDRMQDLSGLAKTVAIGAKFDETCQDFALVTDIFQVIQELSDGASLLKPKVKSLPNRPATDGGQWHPYILMHDKGSHFLVGFEYIPAVEDF